MHDRGIGRAAALTLLMAVTALPVAAQSVQNLPDRDREVDGTLEEVYTVGSLNGADWELLSGVRDADFDADGNLYVLDSGSFRVLKFSPEGEFLMQFGSEGEGPGEMTTPLAMAVLPNGHIAINDLSRRSFTVFDSNGEYVDNHTYGGGLGSGINALFPHPDGGVLYQGSQIQVPEGGGGISVDTDPEIADEVPVLHNRMDGSDDATFFEAAVPKPDVRTETSGSSGETRMMIQMRSAPVWAASLRWSALRSGSIAVASTDGYDVQIVDGSGSAVRSLRRGFTPRVVTDRMQEEYMERRRETLSGGGGPRVMIAGSGGGGSFQLDDSMIDQMLAGTQFASTVPVIRDLSATWDGNLWVMRETEEPGDGEGPVDLISESGEYRGTISDQPIPDAFGPNGLAAYIETDEEWEFEKVVVRRLPAEWR